VISSGEIVSRRNEIAAIREKIAESHQLPRSP
jgi:hypothetical protein